MVASPDAPRPGRRGHGHTGYEAPAGTSLQPRRLQDQRRRRLEAIFPQRHGQNMGRPHASHSGRLCDHGQRIADAESELHVFGHDLLNAGNSRSGIRPTTPRSCNTEHGLTLWFHMAMCFRAAASVWNFNCGAHPSGVIQAAPRPTPGPGQRPPHTP